MERYTKKDKDGRYYIESVNGRLESNIFGHTYGEAIDRFAQLENADVVPREEYEALRINLKAMRNELRSLKTRYEELHYKYQIAVSDGYNKLIVELKEKYTKGGEGE